VLFWACDDPAHSDLALPAIARLGAARVAVSTGGNSPALSARLRAALETGLGEDFARFVDELGRLRARVQSDEPDRDRRRAALTDALDDFAVELRVRYPRWFKAR
jgi:siroheme synthase (precorrin-2 oxidase/ferrochelatase)